MKHYLKNGASAYLYWNISLDEGGISRWGWRQNSLVTVNPENNSYQFNHEYYLLKHLSHFVQQGAHLLNTSGEFQNILAFENPDQSKVIVVQNESKTVKQIIINVGNKSLTASLEPDSFHTFLIE